MTQLAPVTVIVFSRNRPIYLWVCLDSLYRYTRRPARFVLVDNHSDEAGVREVVEGFQRRGMFDAIEWGDSNSPTRAAEAVAKYGTPSGEYFVFVESDVQIFDTEPCWLSRLCTLMDADPRLGMLGSYVDHRDFTDLEAARAIAPHLDPKDRDGLIKAHSPERELPVVPPTEPVIDPFNPPGRLMLLRSAMLQRVSFATDSLLYQRAKDAGFSCGIATQVRHRHLSLLNVFDYPQYDVKGRNAFFKLLDQMSE